jgi:hypothetical protein
MITTLTYTTQAFKANPVNCKTCGELITWKTKRRISYYTSPVTKERVTYYSNYCSICFNSRYQEVKYNCNKQWRERNPELAKQTNRQWLAEKRSKPNACRSCGKKCPGMKMCLNCYIINWIAVSRYRYKRQGVISNKVEADYNFIKTSAGRCELANLLGIKTYPDCSLTRQLSAAKAPELIFDLKNLCWKQKSI